MTAKERAKIYRKAARLLGENKEDFCCHAINHLRGNPSYYPTDSFYEFHLFEPLHGHNWWGYPYSMGNRDCRVLALLLAAEMCKDSND